MSFKEAMASTAAERMAQGLALVLFFLVGFGVCLPLLSLPPGFVRTILLGLAGFTGFVGLMLYLSLFRFHICQRIIEFVVRAVVRLIPSCGARLDADRLGRDIGGFHRGYRAFLNSPKACLGIFLATGMHWGLDILQHYLLFRALHVTVPLEVILIAATAVKIAGVFVIVPGGSGLMEGMNFGLYARLSDLPNLVILSETILFRALDAWIFWIATGVATSIAGFSSTTRPATETGTTCVKTSAHLEPGRIQVNRGAFPDSFAG